MSGRPDQIQAVLRQQVRQISRLYLRAADFQAVDQVPILHDLTGQTEQRRRVAIEHLRGGLCPEPELGLFIAPKVEIREGPFGKILLVYFGGPKEVLLRRRVMAAGLSPKAKFDPGE